MQSASYGWTSIFGHPTELLLDFSAGRLRRIAYDARISDGSAEALFDSLTCYYTRVRGEPTVDEVVAENDTFRMRLWLGEECDIGLTSPELVQGHVFWAIVPSGTLPVRAAPNQR